MYILPGSSVQSTIVNALAPPPGLKVATIDYNEAIYSKDNTATVCDSGCSE